MKKVLLVLCAIFILFICGCGQKNNQTFSFTEEILYADENGTDIPISLENLDIDKIEFSFNDPSISEIKDNQIFGLKMGETELVAKYNNKEATLKVLVNPLINCNSYLKVGDELKIEFKNYQGTLDDFDISFSNEIMEIQNGKIIAVSKGKTEVTLSSKSNSQLFVKAEVNVEYEKPILTSDLEEISIDDFVEFEITNYESWELFDIKSSNEDVLIISDNFGIPVGYGKAIVTAYLKDDASIFASIEITVKYGEIKYNISQNIFVIDDIFTIDIYNYDTEDVLDFSFSNPNVIEKTGEKTYHVLQEGSTTLTISVKDDPSVFVTIDFVAYGKMPIFNINNTTIMVGDSFKLDLLNYNNPEKFDWQISDESLIERNNYIVVAKKTGTFIITVTDKVNKELTAKITIEIIPLKPIVVLTNDFIKVGGTSGFFISNIDKLETNDIQKFDVSIEDSKIVSYENNIFTGLQEGSTTITVTSKENKEIEGKTTITVGHTSEILDDFGEPADGNLILSIPEEGSLVNAGNITYISIDKAKNLENYQWISSDSEIAIVNESGRIIAVNAGTVKISAISKTNEQVRGSIYIVVYGIPNVDYAARLVKIAAAEIGYREGPDNDTKYGAWYHLNYEPWCAMFVSWCANQAGISTDIIPKYCGCTTGMGWFKDRGIFQARESGYIPKAGDITFYRDIGSSAGSTHTGIVYAVDDEKVYTIEGNTSDMCAKRSYPLNSLYIVGYGTPQYPEFIGEPEVFEPGNPDSGIGLPTQ